MEKTQWFKRTSEENRPSHCGSDAITETHCCSPACSEDNEPAVPVTLDNKLKE